jgi:F-type H+-transporting ATPase subunit b
MFVTAALAATETTGAAAEHGGGGAFPPFDPHFVPSQLLWLVISFGLFYFFMARVVLPRIGDIIETRNAKIARDLAEANAMKAEADAAMAAYEQSLTQARNNAASIAGKARDAAKADADAERQRIENDMAKRMQQAETRIDGIRASAMAGLDDIAQETATAIVNQLFGGTVKPADVAAAVKAARSR